VNSTTLELALKKQRLQIASGHLRADFGNCASGLMPVFVGADMAVAGAHWVRRNQELVVAIGVALAVIRPRSALGWARRAFVLWRVWLNFREFLESRLPPIR
jgi:YqjK-like protein